MSSPDWSAVRAQFPALREWTFLNTATMGQLSARTVDAMAAYFQRRDAKACSDFLTWFDDHDRLRAKLGALLHCEARDVAFVPHASEALSLVLAGVAWREGDVLLTLENEFPNHIYGPDAYGVRRVEVPWERFYQALDEHPVRMVALSALNYTNGLRVPYLEIADVLRKRGIVFYLDATQGAGALEYSALEADVFAVHGYKWMLAPPGAAFMIVPQRTRAWLKPHTIGWRSHYDWRNVNHLHHGAPVFTDAAEKYEGGFIASPLLYGLEASVDLMLELGPAAIEQRVLSLTSQAARMLRGLGAELVASPLPTPILAARFPGRDAATLAKALLDRRIVASARHGNLRLSFHFYNDESDLNRLQEELSLLIAAPEAPTQMR